MQRVDVTICSDHKVLPPTAPGDPRTRTRLCSEHLTSGSVSGADRSSPGSRSTYHLASDTSPVAIPICYRRRPPTPAAHHITTRCHPL
ncbi:hypothetical protein TIFTF001_045429 [Ficus carica]|uniref:Uncharacterized protein n=1 Tax=Ficus carica TaxID=3494 RepID=A0AA87YX55_FICCA|nr:hypothetical protein TIFTF001_045429 [Ficus carica]